VPASTGLMTVEEFLRLPESGPFYYELRHGELVQVTRPKLQHSIIQQRLQSLVKQRTGDAFWVTIELPFRALPEYELRAADVGAVATGRLTKADPDGYLQGSPDLVIEVLSPSNTADEIIDKERLCLETDCLEFWVVDPKRHQVRVSKPDGSAQTYKAGQEIPLDIFGIGTLPVNEIFP
jgi:Uma2 family endonuclease